MFRVAGTPWTTNKPIVINHIVRCVHYIRNMMRNQAKIESILMQSYSFTGRMVKQIFKKNNYLSMIHCDQINSSMEELFKLNYSAHDVIVHSKLLHSSAQQLRMRYEILREVGFNEVTPYRLDNYKSIMSQSVHHNQCYCFLPKHHDIVENICRVAGLQPRSYDRITYESSDSLTTIHQQVVKMYLMERLSIHDEQFNFPWTERSVRSFSETCQAIEASFEKNLSQLPRTIVRYAPDELRQLLEKKNGFGVDMQSLILRMGSFQIHLTIERYEWFEALAERYGISDYSIWHCPNVIVMGRRQLKANVERLASLPEPERFLGHPFAMRLVYDMNRFEKFSKANRLNFGRMFDMAFVNYFLNTYMCRGNIAHVISYLSHSLSRSEDEISLKLRQHPAVSNAKIAIIYPTLELLLNAGFSKEEIFECVHIVLYPTNIVSAILQQIQDPIERQTLGINDEIPRSRLLSICAMAIEKKINFDVKHSIIQAHKTLYHVENALEIKTFIEDALGPNRNKYARKSA